MFALSIRIYNGGTDVAAETKYAMEWQGIETSELEHTVIINRCDFMGLCGYKAYDYLCYEIF